MADSLSETAQRYTSEDCCAGLHHTIRSDRVEHDQVNLSGAKIDTHGSDGSKNGKKEAH